MAWWAGLWPAGRLLHIPALNVKLNIFLQTCEFEHRIEDPEFLVDALLETFSAKMKTRNCAAIGLLIDTLKFVG